LFVLGIDPGLSRTGFAVLHQTGHGIGVAAVGVIRTPPDRPVAERLAELFGDVEQVIATYRPEEVAIEEVFVNQNLQTSTGVGRASGVAILAAARAGLKVFEYTPTEVKNAVTGYGKAPKGQVEATVARRLGLAAVPGPADAADACAVAICHLQTVPARRAVERAR
jgi:crossover junction endodeoxyribonuclease RuvC